MTPITKAAQDAIEAFDAMTKGNERDSDGAWGRIVMPSNAALEKADKAAEALRAALQDKADTEDHLFEAFGDGPTDDQCADLWRRYPSLRDWHKRTFGALQDKAGEVRGDEVGRSGHYFQFERGEWVKNGDEPTKFWPASGLHYVGRLTKDQREGLDKLIRDYLDGAKPAPVVPDGFAAWRRKAELILEDLAAFESGKATSSPVMNRSQIGARATNLLRDMIAASQQKGGQHG